MKNPYDLPNLAVIFQELQAGKHLCHTDKEKYFSIHNESKKYTNLFEALGFELVMHPKNFCYFRMEGKENSKRIKQISLFIFILMENLDKNSNDLERDLLNVRFLFEDLPHLKSDRYLELMGDVKVTTEEDLYSVVASMQRYGFSKIFDKTGFELKLPVYRFIDICAKIMAESPSEQTEDLQE